MIHSAGYLYQADGLVGTDCSAGRGDSFFDGLGEIEIGFAEKPIPTAESEVDFPAHVWPAADVLGQASVESSSGPEYFRSTWPSLAAGWRPVGEADLPDPGRFVNA